MIKIDGQEFKNTFSETITRETDLSGGGDRHFAHFVLDHIKNVSLDFDFEKLLEIELLIYNPMLEKWTKFEFYGFIDKFEMNKEKKAASVSVSISGTIQTTPTQ